PGTDDEYLARTRGWFEAFRMPAAPVFLHGGRVLGAVDRVVEVEAGYADVAADALADVLAAPLVDLTRQPGIGDRRPGAAYDVDLARSDDPGHFVRVGEAADPDHGRLGDALHLGIPGCLVIALIESRRPRILTPIVVPG